MESILETKVENNRRQVENVGSEQKSKKIQKELEKLMKRYSKIFQLPNYNYSNQVDY